MQQYEMYYLTNRHHREVKAKRRYYRAMTYRTAALMLIVSVFYMLGRCMA